MTSKANSLILDLKFSSSLPTITDRVINVAEAFGIGVDETRQITIFEKTELRYVKVMITRRFRQQLGRMTDKDARKEGYATLDEFKEVWARLNGSWDSSEMVWVYEFTLYTDNDADNKVGRFTTKSLSDFAKQMITRLF